MKGCRTRASNNALCTSKSQLKRSFGRRSDSEQKMRERERNRLKENINIECGFLFMLLPMFYGYLTASNHDMSPFHSSVVELHANPIQFVVSAIPNPVILAQNARMQDSALKNPRSSVRCSPRSSHLSANSHLVPVQASTLRAQSQ